MVTGDIAHFSVGSAPPACDLALNTDGHCPPAGRHPRIIVAGDLSSVRFQRIMTAMGSGSEAALRAYYAARELL
ncbi:hypothetical protein [Streptomyces cyaneofuscatus]|uniref:hypothetical protein n=1 Tax=Streptomyces cyaneofuscatus TaxID=66883 RepID=UPI0036DE43F8